MSTLPIFTAICPVFNEENTVPLFFNRIRKVFDELGSRYDCQLIFVDNSSTDRTQELVREICQKHDFVSLIVMSRNFGYQCSVECGLRNSQGDIVGVVDVDCEDPPELFVEFLKHYEQGFDVVYGERLDREESALLIWIRKLYYRLTGLLADDYFILDMAEFCIMSSLVKDAILQDNNSFPFIRASIGRVGFKRKNIPYKRHKRVAGETHYNFWRMFLFGIAGVLSSSTFLLRFPAYIFPLWTALMLTFGTLSVVTGEGMYYQLMVLHGFLFAGFTLSAMSIYLARVYRNGLQRPNYIINKKLSILRTSQANTGQSNL